MWKLAVVGGGVTGLAAAWQGVRAGADVTLFEATGRVGGRIRTEKVGGGLVDLGADAFLARVPDALDLCRELGLDDELVYPAAEGAAIWARGRLRPLPGGLVLGAPAGPSHLMALVRAGLVTPGGAARAALDLVMPASRWEDDPSVGQLVTGRLGRQVHERVVDPLVGGIHAGPSELLSAVATAPQLAAAARSRSLMLGLRRLAPGVARRPDPGGGAGTGEPPVFASLRGGMGRLVERLGQELEAQGVAVLMEKAVEAVPVAGFDATVVTTPAPVTAALLARSSPDASRELRAIEHASVALVVMVYPAAAVTRRLTGTGFLVPRSEGRLLTACSFASSKWPHWAGPGDVVLRASAGRWGDERCLSMDDAALIGRIHHELAEAVGLGGEPRVARVVRWQHAFPQYRRGHGERVNRVEAALARDLPGVVVAGATYRGVGIAACIAQGRAAAQRAV